MLQQRIISYCDLNVIKTEYVGHYVCIVIISFQYVFSFNKRFYDDDQAYLKQRQWSRVVRLIKLSWR